MVISIISCNCRIDKDWHTRRHKPTRHRLYSILGIISCDFMWWNSRLNQNICSKSTHISRKHSELYLHKACAVHMTTYRTSLVASKKEERNGDFWLGQASPALPAIWVHSGLSHDYTFAGRTKRSLQKNLHLCHVQPEVSCRSWELASYGGRHTCPSKCSCGHFIFQRFLLTLCCKIR